MTDTEIVRLLAEKVMGWEEVLEWEVNREGKFHVRKANGVVDIGRAFHPFNPLTNDADACAVLDRMIETFDVDLVFLDNTAPFERGEPYNRTRLVWNCKFDERMEPSYLRGREGESEGIDRRRAICLAALKAVGVEVE